MEIFATKNCRTEFNEIGITRGDLISIFSMEMFRLQIPFSQPKYDAWMINDLIFIAFTRENVRNPIISDLCEQSLKWM